MPAPALTTAERRHLALQRTRAEQLAADGCHEIDWGTTFSDSRDGGTTLVRAQDGWCSRGGRSHLRAVIWVDNADILWRFMEPGERCPGAPGEQVDARVKPRP